MTPNPFLPADPTAGRTRSARPPRAATGLACALALGAFVPSQAATVTYDFTSDPSSVLTMGGNGVNTTPWQASGGNPGGFLGLTYSVNGLYQGIVFPNADPGKIVTGFTFTADLRVGNSVGDRAADGFSVSFARDGDPVLAEGAISGMGPFAGGIAEGGTTTGIAVCFDTWSGNTLPDGGDIEGLIVRVDNVTVNRTGLPTRHGACDDNTSLQTGPRDANYWANGGDAFAPESWAGLCWQPFKIDVTTDGKLTVEWKGRKILDAFQTTYFPSSGQLVFAGRTGDANEHTHVDNLRLVTVAEAVTAVPTAPTNLAASQLGSRRVLLTWAASTLPGDPNGRVAYEIERNGVVIAPLVTALTYDDRGVQPGQSVTYKVRGKNIAGLAGPDVTLAVTTVQDIPGVGFVKAEQWTGYNGAGSGDLDTAWTDVATTSKPADRVRYANGFSFGETSNFGDTWGENHLVRMTAIFTPPESGDYRFFVRSDDASALFVKPGTSFGDLFTDAAVAVETGCCGAFEDVAEDGTTPEVTSAPIALTAGSKYALAYFVKEGGGGDWGQVAVRKEGDTTPAGNLTPLRGGVLESPVDGVGASISLTTVPTSQTVVANSALTFTAAATGSSPYGGDYGNAVVYQWYKNGKPILGANAATYTIPVVPIGDNGAKFAVGAGVAGAATLSSEFILTVEVDNTAPVVTLVNGSDTFDSVTVRFSEPVGDATALNAANYTVTGLTLSSPVRVNDRTIKLTSSKQAENTTYNVTVNGVKDLGGNNSAYTGTFRSFALKEGLVTYRTWQNQTGGFATFTEGTPAVNTLAPSTTALKPSYQANTGDEYDNYFGQLTGFFIPETSGNYVFFLSSDDQGAIYLSTDATPANKKKIADEPSWGGRNGWIGDNNSGSGNNGGTRGEDGARSNRSDQYGATEWPSGNTVSLTGGQKYYLEVLFKEGGGGDNGGATFKLASAADPTDGAASTLTGARVATYIDPMTEAPIITKAPAHQIINAGATATFTVEVDSAVPVTYQWYKNNKALAGANGASLVIANAGVANIGDYRVTVTSANGSRSSDDNAARLLLKGAFVVEAEDFNFDNGQTLAAANTMPLASSLFQGKDGQPGVDLSVGESTADGGANGNSLRQGWNDNGTVKNAPAGANADVITDGNAERPDFTLTQNYKIGWGDNGEWFNYTRNFAAGTYSASLGFSWDGRTVDVGTFALDLVTSDPSKPEQTLSRLAQVTVDQTGGWSSNDNVPFINPDGSATTFTLGANSTVRLTIPGGDIDYLLFYKVGETPSVVAVPSDVPGLSGGGVSNVNVNTETKTITATVSGDAAFLKVSGATKIKSVTLVGTTLTVVYE